MEGVLEGFTVDNFNGKLRQSGSRAGIIKRRFFSDNGTLLEGQQILV
jgi:hypothetical protein